MSTPVSVAAFVRSLRKWMEAIEAGRSGEARFYAEQLKPLGRLIALDAEYRAIFRNHAQKCVTEDAEQALECTCAFVHAVTEAALSGRFRTGE